jgi:putative aldouronate transport system substrate-binding protein
MIAFLSTSLYNKSVRKISNLWQGGEIMLNGKKIRFLSCVLILAVLMTLCFGGSAFALKNDTTTKTNDPFGKYATPVEITACRVLTSWMGFDKGEDENNNWWSKMYLEKLGIKLNVEFTGTNWGEPYDQKINAALATDDIPDVMPIYTSLVVRAVKGGKVADITDAYNNYASPQVKKIMSFNNNMPIKACSYDPITKSFGKGRMFGLGAPDEPGGNMIWIRADWLKKINMAEPKTLADLEKVAKLFVLKKPGGQKNTIGISLHKDFGDIQGLFDMFGARNNWVLKGGKLVFGRSTEESMGALKVLAKWYKMGIISKDWASKDPNKEEMADIVSGRVGIVFAGDHAPNGQAFKDCKKNNPQADWIWVPLPSVDGKQVQWSTSPAVNNVNVVGYKCKNPEAVIKLVNMAVAVNGPDKPSFITDTEYNISKGGNMNWWNAVVGLPIHGSGWKDAQAAREALKKGTDASKLSFGAKDVYNQLKSWKTEGVKGKEFDLNWSIDKLCNFGGSIEYTEKMRTRGGFNISPYWGMETDSIAKNGQDWHAQWKKFFTKAIISGKVVEEFDAWVKYFYKNGGQSATDEVNAWYASVNKK